MTDIRIDSPVHDFIGIGLGPFNLSLACLAQPIEGLKAVFLDENPRFDWHPGMLLEDAHLQTPFLSDLVTLADPTSPLSFLNYIKQQGRIYSFYIRENFFLLRREYSQYCQWAAEQLSNIEFDTYVEHVDYCPADRCYRIRSRSTRSGHQKVHRARRLVLGTGTRPYIPPCCEGLMERALHSSDYLYHKERLQARRSITILGSGQSAAEIFHDLLRGIDCHGYELNWITRSPRLFPLEYSKLTLEMTSPEYVDYFHALPADTRDQLIASQKHLYKGINTELINDIYDLLYTKRLGGELPVSILTNTALTDASYSRAKGRFELRLHHEEQDRPFSHETEALVLATGYHYRPPAFLKGIADRIAWDAQGRYAVRRNYSIDHQGSEIFVQNAELHTHGFVTPDLGMACYRNSCLLREITGKEPYPVETGIAFQQFGAPAACPRPVSLSA